MKEKIEAKDGSLKGSMASQGTTPRRLTDLIGSLCDLTSGSGDKGTPIVFIQGSKTESAADGRFSACSAAFFLRWQRDRTVDVCEPGGCRNDHETSAQRVPMVTGQQKFFVRKKIL